MVRATVQSPPTVSASRSLTGEKAAVASSLTPKFQETSMKLRLAVWGIFLALCVTPTFADSLHLNNKGLISASASNSGIDVVSCLTKVSLDGNVLLSGDLGTISFDTGNFTGTLLGGGVFNSGIFDVDVNGFGTILFSNNFGGTWTKISDELYKLVETFSATVNG